MRVLICPDSFKESITSSDLCKAIKKGIEQTSKNHKIVSQPISDGGDGLLEILSTTLNVRLYETIVTGPIGNRVSAKYGIGEVNGAIIGIVESAEGNGLHLVPLAHRNPMTTTSQGVGELLMKVLEHKPEKIIIGLGGSATNDGGLGMLQGLGFSCKNGKGDAVGQGNEHLSELESIGIPLNHPILSTSLDIASDVTNPLLGPNGATYVFSRQKGATVSQLELMEMNMAHYAMIAQKTLGKDISSIPGSGAAGGLGAAFFGFTNSAIRSGFEIVAEWVGLEEKIASADIIITGEGKIDLQTIQGKAPSGVASLARKYNKRILAVCGILENDKTIDEYFDEIIPLSRVAIPITESIANAEKLAIETGAYIAEKYLKD